MKKIEILQWDDLDLIAKYFRARTDWMPYGGMGKSYPYNWLRGHPFDLSKHKENHLEIENILPDLPKEYALNKDYFTLMSIPLKESITFSGSMITHISKCLVGNFNIQRGNITIEAELCGNFNVVEAFWGLSTTRYDSKVKDGETILPEYDWFETNTPQHIGEMSTSVINSYDPYKARQVKKIPLDPFILKRAIYHINIENSNIRTNFNGGFAQLRIARYIPIYPILWNQVGQHQLGPTEPVITKIYSFVLDI